MATSPAPARRVVICGGGVVRACMAYFFSTHPTSPTIPTLIEKSSPACAASGKAAGFLSLDRCGTTPALFALARASFALHRYLAATLDSESAYGFRPIHTLSICLPTHPDPAAAACPPPHPKLLKV
uniref:FAD dependent oxidoreductase domain-containing protein n=1 Tax=Oryza meridionalis TaxID=40149 RepID=A0A0E0EDR5_9ORYZ